jgi:hypothetical protein
VFRGVSAQEATLIQWSASPSNSIETITGSEYFQLVVMPETRVDNVAYFDVVKPKNGADRKKARQFLARL